MLNSREPSTLPSDIERNPREHVKTITLRWGKVLNEPGTKRKSDEQKNGVEEE